MTPHESNSPFFSIIIPTHNRASGLHVPVESILKQTFTDWELIFVDDGSRDNTRQVIGSFGDARIRYIYQENLERSAARNNGITHAQGNYICFLDDDDYYFPDHLASFHRKIVEHNFPVAVLYCDTVEDRDGRMIPFIQPKVEARNPVEWVFLTVLGSPRTCVHRDVFKKYRFNPDISVGEDVDLWVRVFREFPVIYNEAATVAFVTHPGRTVIREESFFSSLENLKRIIREDHRKLISARVRRTTLSNAYLRIAQYYINTNRRIKALTYLFYGLMRFPGHRTKEKIYLILKELPVTGQLIQWRKGA